MDSVPVVFTGYSSNLFFPKRAIIERTEEGTLKIGIEGDLMWGTQFLRDSVKWFERTYSVSRASSLIRYADSCLIHRDPDRIIPGYTLVQGREELREMVKNPYFYEIPIPKKGVSMESLVDKSLELESILSMFSVSKFGSKYKCDEVGFTLMDDLKEVKERLKSKAKEYLDNGMSKELRGMFK